MTDELLKHIKEQAESLSYPLAEAAGDIIGATVFMADAAFYKDRMDSGEHVHTGIYTPIRNKSCLKNILTQLIAFYGEEVEDVLQEIKRERASR
jgi:hypothetical protein